MTKAPEQPYTIDPHPDGSFRVTGPLNIRVIPRLDEECKVFRRNRIKLNNGGREQLLVCEVDGVFLYVDGTDLTLTKKKDI